jgi:phosphate transport system protein
MPVKLDEQLDVLFDHLLLMCHRAGEAIRAATRAVIDGDLTAAEQVFDLNEQIKALSGPCEQQAITLLALHAPVATDLRRVVTGVHLVADLSRMGGLAEHIAKNARRRYPAPVVSGDARRVFTEMGRVATELVDAAEQVLQSREPAQAAALAAKDKELDALHVQLLGLIRDPIWTDSLTAAVDATLLNRFYERFGDHAVEVGRRVVFLATGEQLPP